MNERVIKISRFRGMLNIIRFNWPLYLFVVFFVSTLTGVCLLAAASRSIKTACWIIASAALLNTLVSLAVSHYVYDRSSLYKYTWLKRIDLPATGNFANIHSGFDETSVPLKNIFPGANWKLLDFYNPVYNTEGSIKRARKKYPAPGETRLIDHTDWQQQPGSFDVLFCLFAVHEIRELSEKVRFFKQAAIALKPGGKLIMLEHLRDLPNFLAFGYGFFHFFAYGHWIKAIRGSADLGLTDEFRVTPFVKAFVITKR